MCFNPRTHEGCDLLLAVLLTYTRCFNPRTHEGCDSSEAGNIYRSPSFQSTHPRGVRLQGRRFTRRTLNVSIHAPTRGATDGNVISHEINQFQSTHPRGVRQFLATKSCPSGWFQSTHPRGVRPGYAIYHLSLL